jgi:sugar lactone lactonase YvrE
LEADDESTRFNDAKADPKGRLWAGTMKSDGEPGGGSLYRIGGDYSYERVLSPVDISNGIVWSCDNKMYYTDSISGEIQKFDYDSETGDITNAGVEYKFEDATPDGMAIDSENNLWIALWGEGKVVCVDTKLHRITDTISVDAKLTSAVAFGGENLTTLYITTSRLGLSEADIEKDTLAGGLFRFETGVKGTLFHEFIEKS